MAEQALVDSNVLVYAYDRSSPDKQQRALDVLDKLEAATLGFLTPQNLAEFFVVATRKIGDPLPVEIAYERIENYLQSWNILKYTGQIVLEAVRGVRDYQLQYWDAQLWAAARMNQIPVILSEDFNTGAVLEGVRFLNPFHPSFDLDSWF